MTSVIFINNLTNIGLLFGTCNGIIFIKIQAGCGTTYPRIYSDFAEIFCTNFMHEQSFYY